MRDDAEEDGIDVPPETEAPGGSDPATGVSRMFAVGGAAVVMPNLRQGTTGRLTTEQRTMLGVKWVTDPNFFTSTANSPLIVFWKPAADSGPQH